jgi:predicted permease
MERPGATPGRGIGAFVGRIALGIVTCGLLGLALGMVFKLIWDPNCEHDCDVLWFICTVIGLLVGILAGLFVAFMDRHRRSRRDLWVLLWAAGVAFATIVVALLFGAAETPPPN